MAMKEGVENFFMIAFNLSSIQEQTPHMTNQEFPAIHKTIFEWRTHKDGLPCHSPHKG